MKSTNIRIIILFIVLVCLSACYSFKGGSVPPHLKTIAIPTFNDQSGFGEPNLREIFTNKVKELFIKDNSLELSNELTSDCLLECTILNITNEPSVIAPGETVEKWKITMNVNVVFQDLKLKKKIFEKRLSNWTEYDASSGIEARQNAITSTIDKLSEDILLEVVAKW
ncbi:MAG: hypothetical protein IGBAC_2038 [Ignavibacteriae bacterium]|nr:MAG: hypothetical protein IGBAC_2038 [Ignavibacteriota bacterium]